MGSTLELTAACVDDPRLDERLRAQPRESRRSLLTQADALTLGSRAQRQLAAAVYRALHDDIDPADADGARRSAWFVRQLQTLDPAAAPLVRKTADSCPDEDARMRARLLSARFTASEGDVRTAERSILDVVETARGSGSALESSAFFHAARVAANHEDCVRALAYSWRALSVTAPGVPPRWIALVRRCRADTFGTMRDAVRCERELRAAEAVLPHLDPEDRRSQRAEMAATRGNALLRLGRSAEAIGHLQWSLDETEGPGSVRTAWIHTMLAEAYLARGRSDLAASHVARARRVGGTDGLVLLELDLLQVRLQQTAGGSVSARPHALKLLDRLDTEGRRVAGPACRTRLALAVADVLCDARVDLAEPRRAYDLAATSQLEAVARLDHEASSQPELLSMAPDDIAALSEHRDRVREERTKVESDFKRYFEAAARRSVPAFLAALAGEKAQIAACAWCGRIRGSDGHWLPVAHHLPTEDVLDLTHAICDDCMLPVVRGASGRTR